MSSNKESKTKGHTRLSKNSTIHYRYKNFDKKVKLSDLVNKPIDYGVNCRRDHPMHFTSPKQRKENEIKRNNFEVDVKDDHQIYKSRVRTPPDSTIDHYVYPFRNQKCSKETDQYMDGTLYKGVMNEQMIYTNQLCGALKEWKTKMIEKEIPENNYENKTDVSVKEQVCIDPKTEPVTTCTSQSQEYSRSEETIEEELQTKVIGCAFEFSYRFPDFRKFFSFMKNKRASSSVENNQNKKKIMKVSIDPTAVDMSGCGSNKTCRKPKAKVKAIEPNNNGLQISNSKPHEIYTVASKHKKKTRIRSESKSNKNRRSRLKTVTIDSDLSSDNYNYQTEKVTNSKPYYVNNVDHKVLKQIHDYKQRFNKSIADFNDLFNVNEIHYYKRNDIHDVYQNYYKRLMNPSDVVLTPIESNRIHETNMFNDNGDYTYSNNKNFEFDNGDCERICFKDVNSNLKDRIEYHDNVRRKLLSLIGKIKDIDHRLVTTNSPQAIYHAMWGEDFKGNYNLTKTGDDNGSTKTMNNNIICSPVETTISIDQIIDSIRSTQTNQVPIGGELDSSTGKFQNIPQIQDGENEWAMQLNVFVNSLLEHMVLLDKRIEKFVSSLELANEEDGTTENPENIPDENTVDEENEYTNYTIQKDDENPNLMYIKPPIDSQFKTCDCSVTTTDCLKIDISEPCVKDLQTNCNEDGHSMFETLSNFVTNMFSNMFPPENSDSCSLHCDCCLED